MFLADHRFPFSTVCMLQPPYLKNSNTNFAASHDYSDLSNKSVLITCLPGYEYALHMTNQTVQCTTIGWNMTLINPCYKGKIIIEFARLTLNCFRYVH